MNAPCDCEGYPGIAHDFEALKRSHADLLAALRELVIGAEMMDARLLALTGSPKECERGDIARARAAIAKAVQS